MGVGYRLRGPTNGISYSLGLVHIALAVAGLLIAIRTANLRRYDVVFAGASSSALFWPPICHGRYGRMSPLFSTCGYPWRALCFPL